MILLALGLPLEVRKSPPLRPQRNLLQLVLDLGFADVVRHHVQDLVEVAPK